MALYQGWKSLAFFRLDLVERNIKCLRLYQGNYEVVQKIRETIKRLRLELSKSEIKEQEVLLILNEIHNIQRDLIENRLSYF